jgi:hypothetical protein
MQDPSATRAFTDTSSATCVGRFSFRPATEAWTWSDGMFRIHGFEPGTVLPTTDLMLRHVHPDDVDSVHVARAAALGVDGPFTFPHRIYDAQGRLRIVIAVGHVEDRPGDPEGPLIVGHLVDVTEFRKDAVTAELDQAVQDFTAHRSRIEQAKGVLMQLYSVDADTAWQMLRAYSQDSNRRVRDLADALLAAATSDRTPAKARRGVVHDALDELFQDP